MRISRINGGIESEKVMRVAQGFQGKIIGLQGSLFVLPHFLYLSSEFSMASSFNIEPEKIDLYLYLGYTGVTRPKYYISIFRSPMVFYKQNV